MSCRGRTNGFRWSGSGGKPHRPIAAGAGNAQPVAISRYLPGEDADILAEQAVGKSIFHGARIALTGPED